MQPQLRQTDASVVNTVQTSEPVETPQAVEPTAAEPVALTASEVDALLEEFRQEAQKRKQTQKLLQGGVCGFLGVMLVLNLVLWAVKGKFDFEFFQMFWIFSLFGSAYALSAAQKKAAQGLAQSDDLRVVGPLAELLSENDKSLRALAEQRLTRLLPRLQASDYNLLNQEQRGHLNRALVNYARGGRNTPLALAILKAFEQVGDRAALPAVEPLAKGDRVVPEEIQAAAAECLPYLRERAKEREAQQTLLRAASAADVITPGDTLLRPTTAAPSQTPPEELLRASAPQE